MKKCCFLLCLFLCTIGCGTEEVPDKNGGKGGGETKGGTGGGKTKGGTPKKTPPKKGAQRTTRPPKKNIKPMAPGQKSWNKFVESSKNRMKKESFLSADKTKSRHLVFVSGKLNSAKNPREGVIIWSNNIQRSHTKKSQTNYRFTFLYLGGNWKLLKKERQKVGTHKKYIPMTTLDNIHRRIFDLPGRKHASPKNSPKANKKVDAAKLKAAIENAAKLKAARAKEAEAKEAEAKAN